MVINIIGGKIWLGKLVATNFQIKGGKIFKIAKSLSKADKEINLKGKVVFPGFIDSHVHFRDFEQAYKEDWGSGSRAASAGGITTVIDMPNNRPPILTIQDLKKKHQLARRKSVVNFAFHFGSSEDNLGEIKKLAKIKSRKVVSVKVFMNLSTGKMKIEDKKILKEIFASFPLITVHAEGEKVQEAVELIKQTPNKLYLCHISTKKEINYLLRNKIKGKIFVEVTPHHLFLNNNIHLRGERSLHLGGGFWRMKPSLKSAKDREALWQAINEGLVDTIASDHAPHTIEEKRSLNPPVGVPGIETMIPLLFDAYHQTHFHPRGERSLQLGGEITLEKIVQLCSKNPAKIFGLKNKGQIKEGYDADLTVVDLDLENKVKESELKTKCGWSPFAGWQLKGWPVMTIVNGKILNSKS